MAKYKVDNRVTLRRSYAKGRPTVIQDLMTAGMTRAEARMLSRIPEGDSTVARMARERSTMYAKFKNKVPIDWGFGKVKYEWYKRIRQYYIANRLYTRRSVGKRKRETSPWEWYRRALRREARAAGMSPGAYKTAKGYPKNKGKVSMQKLRARDRKASTLAGRVAPNARADNYLRYARRQIKEKTQRLATATDPVAVVTLNKEISMYREDIARKMEKQ